MTKWRTLEYRILMAEDLSSLFLVTLHDLEPCHNLRPEVTAHNAHWQVRLRVSHVLDMVKLRRGGGRKVRVKVSMYCNPSEAPDHRLVGNRVSI